MNGLTEEQRQRYARQLMLSQVGEAGQEQILAGRVLIIGTGGLGSPAAMYLAAAGIGQIGLVDDDVVDRSNLQRQLLHQTADIGRPKVDSARETLQAINPAVKVRCYRERVTADNMTDILAGGDYQIVLDCTDNFPTKFLINDTCVQAGKAYIHAGIHEFQGQLMTYVPGQGPCYRCLFPEPPAIEAAVSKPAGVLGALAGVIGTLQATEALKYILGTGSLLTGQLLVYDALTMTFRHVPVPRNPHCAICGNPAAR